MGVKIISYLCGKISKDMKYLLTLVSTLVLFASCNKDDKKDYTEIKSTRAVMIYMAGENSLTNNGSHRFLQYDLAEIVKGSKYLADDQRLFVFVDSLGDRANQKGTPYIIEVHDGQAIHRKDFDSDFYSCDPAKFQEIISWMTNNINADGYGLVLWGHANGWVVTRDSIADGSQAASSRRAYGMDTNQDAGTPAITKWMNITQMAKALDGVRKLDFIFADCCQMMCAEVGYELRNATDYLIGSPAEIPGNGAPYEEIVPLLFKNNSELYRGIIDTYYDYYLEAYKGTRREGYSVPLSVIDTRYIAQLAQATRDVLPLFTDGYPMYPQEPDLDGNVFYYGYDDPLMYDMRAFIKKHVSASTFQSWDQVYAQAVPYYRMSMRWMTIYNTDEYYNLEAAFSTFDQDASINGCVSMFIPRLLRGYMAGEFKYNKTCNNFGWNRVIDWSRFGWE